MGVIPKAIVWEALVLTINRLETTKTGAQPGMISNDPKRVQRHGLPIPKTNLLRQAGPQQRLQARRAVTGIHPHETQHDERDGR